MARISRHCYGLPISSYSVRAIPSYTHVLLVVIETDNCVGVPVVLLIFKNSQSLALKLAWEKDVPLDPVGKAV
jgi:hypothetical protein